MKGISYKNAGVDIKEAGSFIDEIKNIIEKKKDNNVVEGIGGFAALFLYDFSRMKNPLIASSTDGVGTKLKIAFKTNIHHSVGIDLVAMCVNDILTLGATPLFLLDYIATGKIDKEKLLSIIKGIKNGCDIAGISLIGGETAQMPGIYAEDEYDIAGFSIGVVDKDDVIDGKNVQKGDILIGISSSGIHSNGFSLVNKVLFDIRGLDLFKIYSPFSQPLYEILLTPTKIYTNVILSLIKKIKVKSMAHITGGGICGNLPRVIPDGFIAEVWKEKICIPDIFSFIRGNDIEEEEMWNVFNMGVGFIIVVDEKDVDCALKHFCENGEKSSVIGRIIKGEKRGVILR